MLNDKLNKLKEKSNINPQTENGFRMLESGILRALYEIELTGSEYRLILFIIDRTWGYKLKSVSIHIHTIAKNLKLHAKTIKRMILNLSKRNIIIATQNEKYQGVFELALIKYYDLWSKIISKNKQKNDGQIDSYDGQSNSSEEPSCLSTLLKKSIKEKRKVYMEDFFLLILSEWNKQNIKPQKEINYSLTEKFKTALTFITKDQLMNTIQTYGKIYHDQKYFFTYEYSLSQFLHSGNMCAKTTKDKGYWKFLPEADPFQKFLKGYSNNSNEPENYFHQIRKTHPFPKIGIKASERLSGVSEGTYLGLDIDFVKNSPYERYELLFEGKSIENITEDYIIHLENIIVMLIYQKENEEFLKKCVNLHLKLLEKYDVKGEEI